MRIAGPDLGRRAWAVGPWVGRGELPVTSTASLNFIIAALRRLIERKNVVSSSNNHFSFISGAFRSLWRPNRPNDEI